MSLALDMNLFLTGSSVQRHDFAVQLGEHLATHGFVRLKNHGLSKETVDELFEWVRIDADIQIMIEETEICLPQNKRFFQLPHTKKAVIANTPGPNPQRGWSSVGSENSSTLYREGLLGDKIQNHFSDARASPSRHALCSSDRFLQGTLRHGLPRR